MGKIGAGMGESAASEGARTCLALTDARPVWGNMSLTEYLQEELSEAFGAYFGANGTESEEDRTTGCRSVFWGRF